MGKRGRPAKPTALKKLEGTFRPDRAARNEWTPPAGAPERPDWLNAEAMAIWDRLTPHLVAGGVVTVVDGEALASYCATQARVRELQRLANLGHASTPQGVEVAKELRESMKLARVQASEFGLNPSSRSRIDVKGAEKQDPVAAEFFGIKGVVEGGKQ